MFNNKSIVNKCSNRNRNNLNPVNNMNMRSVSNLSSNSDVNNEPKDFRSVTLGRNGSMPNLNVTNKTKVDKITKLRFEYDKYLSSLEAKYIIQMNEKKIMSNINEQKKIFNEEFNIIKKQLTALSNELEHINHLKIEKKTLDKKFEIFQMLNKYINFNDSDKEITSLFTSITSKVVVKNFREMNETDLNAVKILLGEIIEPLKLINYENKAETRIQLKDLLLKVTMLTKELDKYKLQCEELFDKQEHLQNYNSSLKILIAQFGENPDKTLLPNASNLLEDIKNEFDKI